MIKTFNIKGMTCLGCSSQVKAAIEAIDGIDAAMVDLNNHNVTIASQINFTATDLQKHLPPKYSISIQKTPESPDKIKQRSHIQNEPTSTKIKQLKPLFLILFYITISSFLLHVKAWDFRAYMLDFMGIFLIVFSFFKILDIKGFATSFSMYDPLAKRVKLYAFLYPFIETSLGLLLLYRFEVFTATAITLILLSITTFGVTKTLINKKSIRCACLGSILNLPMTEATFIENAIMIAMGIMLLT